MKFEPLVNIAYSLLPEMISVPSGSKHFTFILKCSKVLAVGINRPFKSHTLSNRLGHRLSSIHAELDCLIKVRHKIDLSRCTMVNLRLSTDSLKYHRPIFRNSRPCKHCMKLIEMFNVGKIYYSTNDGFEKL